MLEEYNTTDKIKFGKRGGPKSFDFGLGIGAGVQFNKIQIGLGYNLGLTDIFDDFMVKNRGLLVNLSFFFGD
jgi:hypothetical protein